MLSTRGPGIGSRSALSSSHSSSTCGSAIPAWVGRGPPSATTRAPRRPRGSPIARTKLVAYATGATFGGVSGAFIASYFSAVNAAQFQFSFSLFVFSMVVLGGLGSIRGVVVGAIALSAINTYLLPDVLYSLPRRIGLEFDLSAVASGIYGAIIVIVMLLRPSGLLPAQWAVGGQRLEGGTGTLAVILPKP